MPLAGFTTINLSIQATNMEILTLLITISLSIALGFLAMFVWNINSGQFDDTYTPSVRILFNDKKGEPDQIPPKAQQEISVVTEDKK